MKADIRNALIVVLHFLPAIPLTSTQNNLVSPLWVMYIVAIWVYVEI